MKLKTKRKQPSIDLWLKPAAMQRCSGDCSVSLARPTIEVIESAPFGQNCYVVWQDGRDDAIVIDPGFDWRAVFRVLESHHRRPAFILNTHGHVDHIAGNSALKQAYPDAPLVIGRNDAGALSNTDLNLSSSFGVPLTSPAADLLADDGERLELAGFTFEVREIPGHSAGSVVFLCHGQAPSFAFGGDVLFQGSIGRTDLGGSYEQLMTGIFAKLLDLPDDTIIYPGHGPATTIGQERRTNPFVLEHARRTARNR
jgi:glyoxylase-like metal-dependent hydrolase (beta-lactamase superfamily II)